MPIDTTCLPPVPVLQERVVVRDFETEADPNGKEFAFDFCIPKRFSTAERFFLADQEEELYQTWVKGDTPLLARGGYRIPLSRSLIHYIVRMMYAEASTGTLAASSFQDWVLFSVCAPKAWEKLLKWYLPREREALGMPAVASEEVENDEEAPAPPNG